MNKRRDVDKLNAAALAQTLCFQGGQIEELTVLLQKLGTQVAQLSQELQSQKMLIHKSLVQKYGTGPTA